MRFTTSIISVFRELDRDSMNIDNYRHQIRLDGYLPSTLKKKGKLQKFLRLKPEEKILNRSRRKSMQMESGTIRFLV
jgi:hypothetical protein